MADTDKCTQCGEDVIAPKADAEEARECPHCGNVRSDRNEIPIETESVAELAASATGTSAIPTIQDTGFTSSPRFGTSKPGKRYWKPMCSSLSLCVGIFSLLCIGFIPLDVVGIALGIIAVATERYKLAPIAGIALGSLALIVHVAMIVARLSSVSVM